VYYYYCYEKGRLSARNCLLTSQQHTYVKNAIVIFGAISEELRKIIKKSVRIAGLLTEISTWDIPITKEKK
jgi:hypothetical protein